MKITDKRAAAAEANKTWKALGAKGQKRIDKAQPSGSKSRSGARARPSPSKANDMQGSSVKGGSSSATTPSFSGRCSFCRIRAHSPINNGSDNRPPLLEEVEKVGLFKKFMRELEYWGSGDGDVGDDDDVRYCVQCGQVMDYVMERYKEIVRAIKALLDKVPSYEGGEENHGREESEMTAIVLKDEEFVEDVSSYQEDVEEGVGDDGDNVGNVGEDVGAECFLTPRTSLTTEMEVAVPAGDPMDEALGKPEGLEDESEQTPIVVKEEEYGEDTSSYQEEVGEVDSEKDRSPSVTKVLHWGSDSEEDFLKFFENGEGREIEVLSFDNSYDSDNQGRTSCLGRAFHKVLKNNWAPNLRELKITQCQHTRNCVLYEDCDFSRSLENLKVLTVRSSQDWKEEDISGQGFPFFMKAILRGAKNLEKLSLQGPFFPELAAIEKMKNLKSVHFDLNRVNKQFLKKVGLQYKAEKKKGTIKAKVRSRVKALRKSGPCQKTISTQSALEGHLRTHTGEKPLKNFAAKKPFICPFKGCGKKYTSKLGMVIHLRGHTGEMPYPCPLKGCDKAFPSSMHLANHRRRCRGQKIPPGDQRLQTRKGPFPCTYKGCDKTFTLRIHLLSHKKKCQRRTPEYREKL